jgi:hypothetical protein
MRHYNRAIIVIMLVIVTVAAIIIACAWYESRHKKSPIAYVRRQKPASCLRIASILVTKRNHVWMMFDSYMLFISRKQAGCERLKLESLKWHDVIVKQCNGIICAEDDVCNESHDPFARCYRICAISRDSCTAKCTYLEEFFGRDVAKLIIHYVWPLSNMLGR